MMLYRGRYEEAITLYRDARHRCPGHADCQLGEACALFLLGRDDEADHALRTAGEASPPPSHYVLAEVMAARRRYDEALSLLQQSAAARDPLFLAGATSPLMEPLYADPRFERLYRSSRASGFVRTLPDQVPGPSASVIDV
jgi:tetratricopeptide (TPR) repeat protein